MTATGIVFLVAGFISIFLGVTGLSSKTRKGQRVVNLIGESAYRLLNIIVGIGIIIATFFI